MPLVDGKATDRRPVSGGTVMCIGASVLVFTRPRKIVTPFTTEGEST